MMKKYASKLNAVLGILNGENREKKGGSKSFVLT